MLITPDDVLPDQLLYRVDAGSLQRAGLATFGDVTRLSWIELLTRLDGQRGSVEKAADVLRLTWRYGMQTTDGTPPEFAIDDDRLSPASVHLEGKMMERIARRGLLFDKRGDEALTFETVANRV